MNREVTFGSIVRERRHLLGLTQAELARRASCAAITIRKIEADALRPSVQIAEQLAVALNIPQEDHLAFVRLARAERDPSPLPTPRPMPAEIGQEDLTGRAIRGFELGERIGTGGYGVVYRAVQATVDREVAVKIILPKYADRPEFIRRFETEAQFVARLEHPHIVPLYDYWREPGVAYLVMRLLRGGSLEIRLKDGPLPTETVLPIMEQICAGLNAAHRAGVVHRDIKPANILLDDDANAYLADFGIAKVTGNEYSTEMTREGTVIGSPAYISPEQILAEPVKPQTDIYSLGVMLYEMLTGRKPFKGPTPFAYVQQHLKEPLPLLATENGNGSAAAASPADLPGSKQAIPTALDIVIGRATAKDVRERYPDILTMLTDLRQAMTPGSSAATLAASHPVKTEPPHVSAMLKLPDLENPYKGLRPFTEADAADFFGRDTLVQDLLTRLSESSELARFLAVVGPSGSGKSSVVRAGLIPVLRKGGLPGSEKWFIVEMLPGAQPMEELEAALLRVAVNPPAGLLARLREDERGLLRAVRRILPADEEVELVLVIDQFEEMFTLVEAEATRAHLLNSLVTAVLDPRSRLRVITTLRADFTDQPLQYVDFGDLVRQRSEFVLPLTPDELERAIVGPTERAGLSLEPELVPTIIRDLGTQTGMLPLLQYALTELFERRDGRLLTLAAYQESGGVLGALARRADALYNGLDNTEQEMTRQLFLRLVTLGEGAEDTRRRVLRSELTGIQTSEILETSEVLADVIDQFGRYRLLTFDRDPVTRSATVEVAHEALLREWTRLRGWLDDSRSDIRLQRLLASAAQEWLQADRDPGFLLRGSRLDQFEGWVGDTDMALTEDERAYLEASLTARREREAKEEARLQRELETAQKLAETESARAEAEKQRAEEQAQAAGTLRRRAVFLAGALVIAGILAVVAVIFGQQASQNEERAREEAQIATSRELAAAALNNLDTDPERSILLALHSLSAAHTQEAESTLHQAILASRVRHVLTNTGVFTGTVDIVAAGSILDDALEDVTYSRDGTRLATAGVNGVTVWDATSFQELVTLTGHESRVDKVLFTSDGSLIVTASFDGTAKVWDAASGRELFTLIGHTGPLSYAALSPDDKYLVTAAGARGANSEDRTAKVWDFTASVAAAEGQELLTLSGHEADLRAVEFSPDGTRIATGAEDNTARLWDATTGQELSVLNSEVSGPPGWVQAVAFSPDGAYLAGGIANGEVVVWDVASGQSVTRIFSGGGESISEVTFSPDGAYLALTSDAGFAKVFSTATDGWQEAFDLAGHTFRTTGIAFSPDGRNVVSTSLDGTARVWDISPRGSEELLTLAGHSDATVRVAISPDGTRLASASWDNTAKVWDVASGRELLTFSGHTANVNDIAFSPDGALLATSSEDVTAKVWDATTGQTLLTLSDHVQGDTFSFWEGVVDLDFSPDGTRLATAGADNTAKIWDIATALKTGAASAKPVLTLTGHEHGLKTVEFSPDGVYLVTSSSDHTMRVWDAATGEELQRVSGDFSDIADLKFSPDGTLLVTGHASAEAFVWQFSQSGDPPRQLFPLEGVTGFVGSVNFNPDGTRVVTSGNTVEVWDTATGEPLLTIDRGITPLGNAFSPDGKHLVVGGFDNLVQIYTLDIDELQALAQSRVTRSLTTEECQQYLHVEACPAGF